MIMFVEHRNAVYSGLHGSVGDRSNKRCPGLGVRQDELTKSPKTGSGSKTPKAECFYKLNKLRDERSSKTTVVLRTVTERHAAIFINVDFSCIRVFMFSVLSATCTPIKQSMNYDVRVSIVLKKN